MKSSFLAECYVTFALTRHKFHDNNNFFDNNNILITMNKYEVADIRSFQ